MSAWDTPWKNEEMWRQDQTLRAAQLSRLLMLLAVLLFGILVTLWIKL